MNYKKDKKKNRNKLQSIYDQQITKSNFEKIKNGFLCFVRNVMPIDEKGTIQ